jgi:hypothetical protein
MLIICKQVVVKSQSRMAYTAIVPLNQGDAQNNFNDFQIRLLVRYRDSTCLAAFMPKVVRKSRS